MQLEATTDTFLEVGSTHRMCQDYVWASRTTNGDELVFVCDGCSASRDVDVGARLLAHCAYVSIDRAFPASAPFIGEHTIKMAAELAHSMRLDFSALDTTLLIAHHAREHGCVYIYAWGDGVIAYDMGGIQRVVNISYQSGAPYYLSYLLSPVRNESYSKEFGTCVKETESTMTVDGKSSSIKMIVPWKLPYVDNIPARPGYVLLASDGMHSFQGGDLDALAAAREITAFKSLNGEFLTRRMNFFKRRLRKEGITHYDDLGIAAISLQEGPPETDGRPSVEPGGSPGVEGP